MALGSVTVTGENQQQGAPTAIEKYFLFVGVAPEGVGELVYLNTQSDLDAALGAAASALKTQVAAARANGGQSWACVAAPVASAADWETAVDLALADGPSVEAVVLCFPVPDQAAITAYQTKAVEILGQGRRLWFVVAAAAIVASGEGAQTWGDYATALSALTTGVVAERVMVVPQIFPDTLGILAGRLCRHDVSVADSPMRVATGSLIGRDQGAFPVDSAGVRYGNAHAQALNDARLTVPQTYPDYPGVYFSDGQTLDGPTGDYAVIENLRVVDKAARAVRLILIGMVADRKLNNSPDSEAWAVNKMGAPLRAMSKSYTFQGVPFVADIEPPKDGDIAIQWVTRTQVSVYLKVTPYNAPKSINAYILLDLSAA